MDSLKTWAGQAEPFLRSIHCSRLRCACSHGARDHPRLLLCDRAAWLSSLPLAWRSADGQRLRCSPPTVLAELRDPQRVHAAGGHGTLNALLPERLGGACIGSPALLRDGRLQQLHRTAGCFLRARLRVAHSYGVVAAAERGKRRCVSERAASSGQKLASDASSPEGPKPDLHL